VLQFFILKSGLIFEDHKAQSRRSERCQKEVEGALKKRERKDRANISKGVNKLYEKADATAMRVESLVNQMREVQEQQMRGYNAGKVHPDFDDDEYNHGRGRERGGAQASPAMLERGGAQAPPAVLRLTAAPTTMVLPASVDSIEGPPVGLMLLNDLLPAIVLPSLALAPASAPALALAPAATVGNTMDTVLCQMILMQQQQQQQQMIWQQQQHAQQEVMRALFEEVRTLRGGNR
jgi:hypothetical protein